MMEYRGYVGKAEFDDEADLFHGEVVNTRDVITFQGKSVDELRLAFHESVDNYLAFCGGAWRRAGQAVFRPVCDSHQPRTASADQPGRYAGGEEFKCLCYRTIAGGGR
uniref:HicB family protein n=1 Tax=Rubinisphaera brasiliensis (strain ATCC 49424 / DSM 5305 / JCM 21570 / IAM 15109 / NBRC 103401 / IFAM 1448) TaxID=756272 RepID=F0SG18_RUBBR|nr:hypothetical protein Plabr_0680 [Rubinisphaera brasiliensis DSM 5305]